MELNNEFVAAVRELGKVEILSIKDRDYATALVHNLPRPDEPGFPTVKLESLDGLVDYIGANRDKIQFDDSLIIANAIVVQLVGRERGFNRQRDILVQVSRPILGATLQYVPLEDFRVSLLVNFQESPDRDKILRLIANISDENIQNSQDNGVTQTVTAKVGLATHAQVEIPSPVILKPIRTFIEVEQPEGKFVFRLKSDKGVQAALFEIDTNWKRDAAVRVAAYLKAKLPSMTVLA